MMGGKGELKCDRSDKEKNMHVTFDKDETDNGMRGSQVGVTECWLA